MARRGASELAVLKSAEEEAAKIVAAAREERKLKLRAAAAEAAREVDEYKAMREMKLKQSNPEADGLRERVRRVEAETTRRVEGLEGEYAHTKDAVINMLLSVVLAIDNPYAGTAAAGAGAAH